MTDCPLVSICVPTYNAANTVRETLVSILTQTYPNLVVHISDNASIDDTIKVIEALVDPRIIIHRNETNIGGEGNFNRCIQLAEGEYTAIFHADDIYEPDMVSTQVAFLRDHQEVGAVFTEASVIDDAGSFCGNLKLPEDLDSPTCSYGFKTIFKAVLKHSNFLICPSVMARTCVYQQEIKGWRGDLFGSSADLDVWLRVAQQHKIAVIPMPLMRYRVGAGQFSANVRLQTGRADFFRVTDFYLAQNDVRSLLDGGDLQHYAWLERRDRVMRAVNLFLTGMVGEAGGLLKDIYSWDTFKAAMQSKRGLGVLAAGVYMRLLLLLKLNKLGQSSLGLMKRVMKK